jgi:outer membrane protein with beta-barrel domain
MALAGLGASGCWAQKWEVGGLGGGSFYKDNTVSNGSVSGNVGFKSNGAFGAFLGNTMYKYVGGELRYEFIPGDLKVSSGGTEATFKGRAQAIHYDILFHFAPVGTRVRPYVAGGGGVKIYEGTGTATATQPLSNLALLTHTHETSGLGSVGAGVKFQGSSHMQIRFEVRDFITPFPKQVIAAAPGAKISGILHNIVVLAGVAYTF